MVVYRQSANPTATNSELDAKRIVTNNALDLLSELLVKFCNSQDLELQSADDILYCQNVTNHQRNWLLSYIELWDYTQEVV
tara:strand:- start:202 stop:444 length:243 start_codon:yes stop_codon:yes gene_type:complete